MYSSIKYRITGKPQLIEVQARLRGARSGKGRGRETDSQTDRLTDKMGERDIHRQTDNQSECVKKIGLCM